MSVLLDTAVEYQLGQQIKIKEVYWLIVRMDSISALFEDPVTGTSIVTEKVIQLKGKHGEVDFAVLEYHEEPFTLDPKIEIRPLGPIWRPDEKDNNSRRGPFTRQG